MTRYILKNPIWPPAIGSIIVIQSNKQNIIGVAHELLDNNNIMVVMLNRTGKLILNKKNSWFIINAPTSSILRLKFEMYDESSKNMNEYVSNHYKLFSNKYKIM